MYSSGHLKPTILADVNEITISENLERSEIEPLDSISSIQSLHDVLTPH